MQDKFYPILIDWAGLDNACLLGLIGVGGKVQLHRFTSFELSAAYFM
jgi:hypothetical protein